MVFFKSVNTHFLSDHGQFKQGFVVTPPPPPPQACILTTSDSKS